ncbi:MAG: deoxyribose-phosphate aldolase [Blastopirellula sp.]|nr:MAG: deoxyribose-phosphate aldolase [Blastopirellula sp.]
MSILSSEIASMIDHSLLLPTLTTPEFEIGCQTAINFQVASVCCMPFHLKRCAEILQNTQVKASTTIGFPQGVQSTKVKLYEAEQVLADGCQELDMVVNPSWVQSGDWDLVRNEIDAIVSISHQAGQKVKVIFENCNLNRLQKIRLCQICSEVNADWVKTSTGFGTSGAKVEDIRLMVQHTPGHIQVKAAGGIRDLDTLLQFRDLGATRIGTSSTEKIMKQVTQFQE